MKVLLMSTKRILKYTIISETGKPKTHKKKTFTIVHSNFSINLLRVIMTLV